MLLNGLIPHSVAGKYEGVLTVLGESPRELGPSRLASRVGLIFQNPESQFCTLRIDDEIAFGLENLGTPREEMERHIEAALRSVGMWEHRRRRLDRLSGGMKQRVAVASVIAMSPDLIVLDEPVAHMDPGGAGSVVDLLKRLARDNPQLTLVLIEHRLDVWIELMDRVWILSPRGELIADGSPREVYGAGGQLSRDGVRETHHAIRVWRPTPVAVADWSRARGVKLEETPLLPAELIEQARADEELRQEVLHWAEQRELHPTAHAEPLLTFRDVSYRYPDGTRALDRLSLDVAPGTITAVLGNNGSGKTTLAELAVGLRKPIEGRVRLGGDDVAELSARDMASRCGFVFQNPEHQFVTDSVYEEIAFSLRRRKRPGEELEQQVETLLAFFGLTHKSSANPFELSQGEKRRLSVATMLVTSPQLLILDEPTYGQDPGTAGELAARFQAMSEAGIALLLITHDLDLVWRIADRAAILERGSLVASGDARTLLADSDIMERHGLQSPLPARLIAELKPT